MLTKKQVLKTIKEMPEAFSANELIDRIILLQKVEQATQEIRGRERPFYRTSQKTVEKMAELIWTPSALADIDNIAIYIAHNSMQGAKTQVASFFDKAKILETFPEIGRLVPELKDIRYRQILEGRYRIIYQVMENEVYILTVHHQSILLKNNPVFKSKLKKNNK